jgi:hypothetical protein
MKTPDRRCRMQHPTSLLSRNLFLRAENTPKQLPDASVSSVKTYKHELQLNNVEAFAICWDSPRSSLPELAKPSPNSLPGSTNTASHLFPVHTRDASHNSVTRALNLCRNSTVRDVGEVEMEMDGLLPKPVRSIGTECHKLYSFIYKLGLFNVLTENTNFDASIGFVCVMTVNILQALIRNLFAQTFDVFPTC